MQMCIRDRCQPAGAEIVLHDRLGITRDAALGRRGSAAARGAFAPNVIRIVALERNLRPLARGVHAPARFRAQVDAETPVRREPRGPGRIVVAFARDRRMSEVLPRRSVVVIDLAHTAAKRDPFTVGAVGGADDEVAVERKMGPAWDCLLYTSRCV